jgi:hypothetical protein
MSKSTKSDVRVEEVSIVDDILVLDGKSISGNVGYLYVFFDDLTSGNNKLLSGKLTKELILELEEIGLVKPIGRNYIATKKMENSIDEILLCISEHYST